MNKCKHGIKIGFCTECDEVYELKKHIAELQAKLDKVWARIEELEAGYRSAIDDIEDWGAYADEYFRDKHGLDECIGRHRALLGDEAQNEKQSAE